MKTKEQILEHLKEVGYIDGEVNKIMGFLIGKGLKEPSEQITYKRGGKDFNYFLSWFNEKIKTDMEHIADLINFLRASKDNRIKKEWIEVLCKADVLYFIKVADKELKNTFDNAVKETLKNPIEVFYKQSHF